jgi:hypothetical protein
MKAGDRKPKPAPKGAAQQQQQVASGEGKQYGEGSYEGTRRYNQGLKEHLESHDVEREARDAEPRSSAEEKEMQDAERAGRSRARSGPPSPDDPEDGDLKPE